MVFSLSLSAVAWGQTDNSEEIFEPLDLDFVLDRTYRASIPTMYLPPDSIMVSVKELFDVLKVPNTSTEEGKVVKGFFETESNGFEINILNKTAKFQKNTVTLSTQDYIMDMGMMYLNTKAFKKIFGFGMAFNDRALSVDFSSPFELPLFKLMKQEKSREQLGGTSLETDVKYDTIIGRKYHWFEGHMLDWGISATQSENGLSENRFSLGYGAEILGGEAKAFLNYSDKTPFTRNQQTYSWRWADNSFAPLRQVMLGRIPTRAISSLLSPIDGFVLTNASTTVRKALGHYIIEQYTEPDWVVELYVNNQLMTYARADATGFFTFKVPIVYGTSFLTLRFYGPNGEIRSEEKSFSMPFNMLPKGEFEYNVNGGLMLDSASSRYGQARVEYGLSRFLTLGMGAEYLSSVSKNDGLLFANATFQPFSRLLITAEYAPQVRSKMTANLSLPGNIVLDGMYADYNPNQKYIIYNYKQERMLGLSIPYRYRLWSGSVRTAARQNVYPNFTFSSAEINWSNNIKNYTINYTNYFNASKANANNFYGQMTLGTKIRSLSLRTSAQYNYVFNRLISLRAEIDRKLFANGFASLKFENNLLSNSRSLNVSFRYELPFMMANASASYSNKKLSFSEGANGSFAFNSGGKYVHVSNRGAVGRSGVSIAPFIDVNFNGVRDGHEPISKGLRVRSTGGRVLDVEADSIIRIIEMEPFVDYGLILDESGFDNVSLKASRNNMRITSDPNQFKKINLPIYPMAEISGLVVDENDNGIGRILIRIVDENGHEVTNLLTESDGYFNYIGLKPGDYSVFVDSVQLKILKYNAEPAFATVLESIEGDVIDVGTIQLKRAGVSGTTQKDSVQTIVSIATKPMEQDSLSLFVVLFDVDKTEVKVEYHDLLRTLAHYLNKPEHAGQGLDIQGHTDSDAGDRYNLILSNRRAEAVKQLLVQYGVHPKRLKTSAFGLKRLLNQEKTDNEKARNRRVEFKPIPFNFQAERPFVRALIESHIDVSKSIVKEYFSKEKNMLPYKHAPEWCLMFESEGKYMFQVAAFNKYEQAMTLAEKLLNLLPEKIMIVNQGVYIKVQMGFYDDAASALKDATLLKQKGFIN